MARGSDKNKARAKSKKRTLRKIASAHLAKSGSTVTDAAAAGRARAAAEKADYPTLKRLAAANLEKLKNAQLAKRRESRVRKSAEETANEERKLLARERVLRDELRKELEVEQRRRMEAEQQVVAATVRQQALEHQRQQQIAADEEAMAKVTAELRDLRLEKNALQAQQLEVVKMFCPETASAMVMQQQNDSSPLLSAKDQLIRSQMEVEQARRELEAASAWGKLSETRNANLRKKNTRQGKRIEQLTISNQHLKETIAARKAEPVSLEPEDLDRIVETRILDNLRPRQKIEVVEEVKMETGEGEGGGEGGQEKEKHKKDKQGRRAYGVTSARLVQTFLQAGNPLAQVGPLIMATIHAATGVQLDVKGGKTKFSTRTVKQLALGIAHLDLAELIKAIMKAPYLLIAGDESLRKGDKKFPIFVAFWDVEAQAPWWGMLRICSMKDKTAQTQAELFHETITDVLGYPRHQVLFVLSDNTASVSGETGGCVALLQEILRADERKAAGEEETSGRGGAGGTRGRGRGNVNGNARGTGRGNGRGRGRGIGRGRGRGNAGGRGRGNGRGRGRGNAQGRRGRGRTGGGRG